MEALHTEYRPDHFFKAFAELRKAIISLVMSVCPSIRLELGSHWSDFHEI